MVVNTVLSTSELRTAWIKVVKFWSSGITFVEEITGVHQHPGMRKDYISQQPLPFCVVMWPVTPKQKF